MPTYEYRCTQCFFLFELKRGFKDDSPVSCPKCQGRTQRLFSSVPIILKGSGFYSTDKEKKSWWRKPGMEESMADAKPEVDKTLEDD